MIRRDPQRPTEQLRLLVDEDLTLTLAQMEELRRWFRAEREWRYTLTGADHDAFGPLRPRPRYRRDTTTIRANPRYL